MNKFHSVFNIAIKKGSGLGLGLSLLWLLLTSFLYIDSLRTYPDSYDELLGLPIPSYAFYWEEDVVRRDLALEYAKNHGNEVQANRLLGMGFKFLKPTWSFIGYFKLVLWPIIFAWLMVCALLWRRKYFVLIGLISMLFVKINHLLPITIIYLLFSICLAALWLLLKRIVYALSFEFYRAKNNF